MANYHVVDNAYCTCIRCCFYFYIGSACPSGWVAGTCESCYKFMTTPAMWHQARGICADMGGHLATLETEHEAAFIAGYMTFHGLYNMNIVSQIISKVF